MLGKKIPTIIALFLLIAVATGGWIFLRSQRMNVREGLIPKQVVITNVADNKFSVSWTTDEVSWGGIEYGSVGEPLDKKASDDRGEQHEGKTHHVTVTQLQPDTQYAFRLLSGTPQNRFDNNGSVYTQRTASTLASVPAARSLYGDVSAGSADTLVYVALPNAQPASTTLTSTGAYSIPLSVIRSADLKTYVEYDPAATIVTLRVTDGDKTSEVNATTTNITPVPTIALGVDADFRTAPSTPQVAEVMPQTEHTVASAAPVQIFNVEPLADPTVNEVTNKLYTLLNPAVEGEVLSTTRPEFRGTGSANEQITISITGQKNVTDTVRIGAGGEWSWSPSIALTIGKQKITINYKDKDGKQQKIERGFSISTASATSEPAFVSTPSASVSTTASASPKISPSPRTNMPATESGVPVTGVITPTLLTAGLSFAIMLVGALLLAL